MHRPSELIEASRHVLIVEDDLALAGEMAEALESYGITSDIVSEWGGLMERLDAGAQDLILLDQRLGRVNTLNHLANLRTKIAVPILVVTGNPAEIDRVLGLELGADDFLVKPISGRELAARVHAHLRRDDRSRQALPAAKTPSNGWRLAEAERRLYRPDGRVVGLTSAEIELLILLVRQPGIPVSRADLTMHVFKRQYDGSDRSLDTMASRIRHKIGCNGHSECIVSVRNSGYVFTGFP